MTVAMTITGRLGRDPELRFSNSGIATCKFSVAVSRSKKIDNEWKEETVWMDVTCFRELAENASQSLFKGDEVIAHGFIEEPRSYEKKDGTVGVSLPFVANDLGASLRWNAVTPTTAQKPKPKQVHSEEPF